MYSFASGCVFLVLVVILTACTEAVPQDVVEAIESIDRNLMDLRAAELAPDDYSRFAHQWIALKARVEAEEDLIHWPWEPNELDLALRKLYEEGIQTVARVADQRKVLRETAEHKLTAVENRFQVLTDQVGAIDSRLVLGQQLIETDLLVKQARAFFEDGKFERSIEASDKAGQMLTSQATVLSNELGRYADHGRIGRWQRMAKDTIAWSQRHHTSAIIVSKADRVLTLYKNGQKVLSYPVRLGFNGIREKRYQGDGATPEGRYHITGKRGQGQTQFYRALLLDYPNEEDRRRFHSARKTGLIPASKGIGGQIEIHGVENELMAQTLGCVMLENAQMVYLYDRVEKGTPVTIVGALHEHNSVAEALANLGQRNTI
ncbi:MAG TPA: L,D-transpeptidase [Nitrospiraceae bacterium]|nr:L,D-transpeptidase [Nitrospiraceae bacterium]